MGRQQDAGTTPQPGVVGEQGRHQRASESLTSVFRAHVQRRDPRIGAGVDRADPADVLAVQARFVEPHRCSVDVVDAHRHRPLLRGPRHSFDVLRRAGADGAGVERRQIAQGVDEHRLGSHEPPAKGTELALAIVQPLRRVDRADGTALALRIPGNESLGGGVRPDQLAHASLGRIVHPPRLTESRNLVGAAQATRRREARDEGVGGVVKLHTGS